MYNVAEKYKLMFDKILTRTNVLIYYNHKLKKTHPQTVLAHLGRVFSHIKQSSQVTKLLTADLPLVVILHIKY